MIEADRIDKAEREAAKACDAFAALVRLATDRQERGVAFRAPE